MVVKVPLHRAGLFAIVDDEDAALVAQTGWRASPSGKTYYAISRARPQAQHLRHLAHMHRLIMRAEAGQKIDHINGNGLDNRRSNLRVATAAQNAHNSFIMDREAGKTSRFKGVCWNDAVERWQAQIQLSGAKRTLGTFRNEEDAARAYDAAAKELFGEFARTNGMLGMFTGETVDRAAMAEPDQTVARSSKMTREERELAHLLRGGKVWGTGPKRTALGHHLQFQKRFG